MKKKWTIATVLLLAVALLAVGTWAYFSAVGRADNVITMGSVKLALHDEDGAGQPFTTVSAMPGSAVNKVVYVENVGSGAFYTRVKITPEMVGADGEIIPLDASERLLTLDLNDTDWIAHKQAHAQQHGRAEDERENTFFHIVVLLSQGVGIGSICVLEVLASTAPTCFHTSLTSLAAYCSRFAVCTASAVT